MSRSVGIALAGPFAVLFLAGIAVTGGPFWSRYYSHIVGPWLLAAAPALGAFAARPGSLRVALTYLGTTAFVAYAMVYWEIF